MKKHKKPDWKARYIEADDKVGELAAMLGQREAQLRAANDEIVHLTTCLQQADATGDTLNRQGAALAAKLDAVRQVCQLASGIAHTITGIIDRT